MVFSRIQKCLLAATAAVTVVWGMVGSLPATAQQESVNEDLLNPTLDQPLAQYQSTGAVAFEPIVDRLPNSESLTPPAAPESLPPVDLPASDAGNGHSVQLAPNPLADPGALSVETANPIEVQPKPALPTKRPAADNSVKPLIAEPSLRLEPPAAKPKTIPTKKPVEKKPAKKKTTSAKKKKPAYTPKQPVLNFEIYRDVSPWPIDPRKPINPCTQQAGCHCGMCAVAKPGLRGRPHQPHEPGGCQCGKKCQNKHPQFSVYWPRPFSAKLDERDPQRAADRYSGCQKPRLNDKFDRFANFRLIDYQRRDNGYCGPESDPYGCLGESKTTGVSGVGFRIQSEPVAPAGMYPLR